MGRRNSRRGSLFLALAALVAVALLSAACSAASNEALESQRKPTDEALPQDGAPQNGGTLVVGTFQETSGWNPTYDRWAQMGALVGSTVLEPLTTLDADGRAQPWLATSWEPNGDFTSWTVQLREGVTFHDGAAFDADSVVANVNDGITAILSGVALNKILKEAVKVGPHTVRIDLKTPWSAFPEAYLPSQAAMQRSPASITAGSGSSHPVGTGPFVFKDWKRDTTLTVEKNPKYWRPGEPHVDSIEFRVIIEDGSRASALRANDLDLMFTTSAKDATELDEGYTVVRDWDTEQTMLIANTRPMVGSHVNPMSNEHGRRAVALATDRAYIGDLVGQGIQLFSSPFSPDSPWGQPESATGYLQHNPEEARKEVAQYLAETGQKQFDLQVLGLSDTNSQSIMQALQSQWNEVGITSSVKTLDATAMIQHLIGSDYDLAMASPYSAPDPDQDFYFWQRDNIAEHGKLSINFAGFANETTERLMTESRTTADPAQRHALFSQLVQELNRNLTTIWLYATPFSLIAADRVHGLKAVADVPFANYQPKVWWGQLWLAH